MVGHVFVVPVALQPVLGSVLLDKIVDSVPEVVGLQQQQLDDEIADLSLVALVATHRLEGAEPSDTQISSYSQEMQVLCVCIVPINVRVPTRHRMSRSRVTMLYFQTMSLRISMHLLSCCPPAEVENS